MLPLNSPSGPVGLDGLSYVLSLCSDGAVHVLVSSGLCGSAMVIVCALMMDQSSLEVPNKLQR